MSKIKMAPDGSTGGNTNPVSQKKRISPAIYWCFTLHNYCSNDVEIFNNSIKNGSKYICFSEEVGKSGETPHLQGYVEFIKKSRPMEKFANKQIHWEKAGGSREDNFRYITKEGGRVYLNGSIWKPLKTIKELYTWQKRIIEIIDNEADDRTINWVWEDEGCVGKSALCKYICVNYKAIVLSNKASDMKYGIVKYIEKHGVAPDVILIDIPRSVDLEYLSYTGIEEIKNGCFFSPKYECDMCIFNSPHVIVFSNEQPNTKKMSLDRWNIIELTT